MTAERRTKRVGFRVGPERLSVEETSISLPVSLAKDFIVSCMYASESNKYLTKEMAKEMTSRFKVACFSIVVSYSCCPG